MEEHMKQTVITLFSFLLITCTFISLQSLQAQVERIEKGNLVIEEIPEIPQRIIDRMYQYQSTRFADIEDWTADGKGMMTIIRMQ
jgi:hypothetical protein